MIGKLYLRPSNIDDCSLIYDIITDPLVIQATFKQKSILWDEHKKWYFESISNPKRLMYVIEDYNKNIIGQLRFDIEADKAEVSIVLNKQSRGQGYGAKALYLGCIEVNNKTGIKEYYAYIKNGNRQSLKTFRKAGFIYSGYTYIEGIKADMVIYKTKA